MKSQNKTDGFLQNITTKILTTIFPKANPDYDHLIGKVCMWKLEYNTKQETTEREIGFDETGTAILALPTGNNAGYWTDNSFKLKDYHRFQPTTIPMEEFENDWNNFIENN